MITKEHCYHQCKIWFALQDWQVWKCWEMEVVLFLWSHSTFSAVFRLRIFTGVRNKVSPTINTLNFNVCDCYGQYLRLNLFFIFYFIFSYLSHFMNMCVCVYTVVQVSISKGQEPINWTVIVLMVELFYTLVLFQK